MKISLRHLICFALIALITACSSMKGEQSYPMDPEDARRVKRGKLTGEGLTLFGGSDDSASSGAQIGINSYLWRATLDTLSFIPLASADPFGGVIITDWYEDPQAPNERFKVNVVILDTRLRADGVRVSLFKQIKDRSGVWKDTPANPAVANDLEDKILTRARELRMNRP